MVRGVAGPNSVAEGRRTRMGQGEGRCVAVALLWGVVIRASTSDKLREDVRSTKVWILPCCRQPTPGTGGYVTD